MHAAEGLLAAGHGDGVREVFRLENDRHGDKPEYRIGIWRVLASTSEEPAERERWVRKIKEAFLDLNGPDRIHAAEGIAKLRAPMRPATREVAWRAAESPDPFLSVMTAWALAANGDNKAEQLLNASLASKTPVIRRVAAYAFRAMPCVSALTAELLVHTARAEPPTSPARSCLVGAALVHAGSGEEAASLKQQLLKFVSGAEADRREVAATLSISGVGEDLLCLDAMFSEAGGDTRICLASAIMQIQRRMQREPLSVSA